MNVTSSDHKRLASKLNVLPFSVAGAGEGEKWKSKLKQQERKTSYKQTVSIVKRTSSILLKVVQNVIKKLYKFG